MMMGIEFMPKGGKIMDLFLKTGKLGSGTTSNVGGSKQKQNLSEKAKKVSIPWVEKYRPKSIEDVVYQDEVVSVLRKTLTGADFPNLLFYGPPGTGKTSTILALARELFGDLYRQRVMELNASDERGIQVIRDKVKKFAQTAVSSTSSSGHAVPPYKIIILDEADSMTSSAQAALRRTMEKQSRNTRFCLLCNYVSRIIDPLTSRCSKFRFKPLSEEVLVKHLNKICDAEGVTFEEGVVEQLIETCQGDLRKAIMFLQSLTRLKGDASVQKQDVFEVTGAISIEYINELLETCKTDSYDKLKECVDSFFFMGFSATQLIYQLHDEIISHSELSDEQKMHILEKIALCDHRLNDGADEFIQVMDLCCCIMNQFCHPNRK